MRRAVICIGFVLGCRHAAPADRAGRGIPTKLSALTGLATPHVTCPAHFADARGVCTTNGGESDRCRYPEGTCRCERSHQYDAVLYLHGTWSCEPALDF